MAFGSLTLNTGTCLGNGYETFSSSYGSSSMGSGNTNATSVTGNRVASSTNLTRVSKDIAQGYNQDIEVISLYLQQGNVDEALSLYKELFDDVKMTAENYGYELSDGQISSIVNQAFQSQTGMSFTSAMNENTSSSFATGLKNGIPIIGWFFTQHDSDADALAKLTGTKPPAKATAAECAGGVLSGAACGAAVGTVICPGAGTVIGAIAGGAIGLIRGLF